MKKSTKKQALWITAAAVAFLSLAYWTLASGRAARPALETLPVEFGDLTVELPATGTIDAVNVIDVGAAVSGRIKALYADFNSHVKAGQLVAEIDDDTYRATFLQAQADVSVARAAVDAAAANLEAARGDHRRAVATAQGAQALYERARLDWERNQKLFAEGIVAKATLDRLEAAYRTARAEAASSAALVEQAATRIQSSQAALEQARATLEQRSARAAVAKRNLDYCRITSPVDGIVVSRNVDVGQTVAARLQAPSIYNIAEDLTHMYVYTKLDSSDVAKVRPGLPATFTVNAFPRESFEGTLVQVRINANAANPTSRAVGTSSQFQRSISAGITAGSDSTLSAVGTSGTGSSGSSSGGGSGSSSERSGGSSRSSSAAGGLPQASSSSSASNAPPTGTANTVVVYDALIEFRNPEQKLLPGMTAYVTIPIAAVKDTLKVPSAALRFSPDLPPQEKQRLLEAAGLRENDPLVWVVTGNQQYRPVRVKPTLTDYVYTAVQSDQLQAGMQVATRIIEEKPAS